MVHGVARRALDCAQQSAAAVHQPGSPLMASTQDGGVVAWLQTSPPHVLPLAMQSESFVHFAPVPTVVPSSPVALGTLPAPIKLLCPRMCNRVRLADPNPTRACKRARLA